MRVLITGGHLSPALAVIEELKKKNQIEIIYVGRKYPLEGEKVLSLEYQEINRLGIKFENIVTGRLTRVLSIKSLVSVLKIPVGFFQSFFIIEKHQPDIILSFGSYVAVPLVFWAFLLKIPIYTHEQTIKPGIANRIIGFFAKKIFLAFEETKKFFPQAKTLVVGNPIKSSIFKIQKKPFTIKKKMPVIYITGGSLGSHSINIHIKEILSQLLRKYIIIHQTGDTKEFSDYQQLLKIKESLSESLKENYFLKKYFFNEEIGYIYSLTDLVISRAGANIFFELISLKKPAILIPLPWSAGREQQHHAEIFVKNGFGEIFHQREPSSKLVRLINLMIEKIDFYKKNFLLNKDFSHQNEAAEIIVSNIFS